MGHHAQFEDEGEGADDSKGAAKILKEAQDGAKENMDRRRKRSNSWMARSLSAEAMLEGEDGMTKGGGEEPRYVGARAKGPERDTGHVDEEGFPGMEG